MGVRLARGDVAAWQRPIRVFRHELRDSLTPIMSMTSSPESLLASDELPHDWRAGSRSGLDVIAGHADSLNRLMSAH